MHTKFKNTKAGEESSVFVSESTAYSNRGFLFQASDRRFLFFIKRFRITMLCQIAILNQFVQL